MSTRKDIESDEREADFNSIKTAKLPPRHIKILIEEARRLSEAEMARRSSAETRAKVYLAVVSVLIPILVTVAPSSTNENTALLHSLVTLTLFILTGAYVVQCGFWSLKTLEVGTIARVDAVELCTMWEAKDPRIELAKKLLYCVRWQRNEVNKRITHMQMAHKYCILSWFSFVLTIMAKHSWAVVVNIFDTMGLFCGN